MVRSPGRSRLVAAYRRSLPIRRRFGRRLSMVVDGVWLGLLDRDELLALDEHVYDTATEPVGDREVGYADDAWNTQGLAAWEAAAIERFFPAGGRVVVTGAGGGREVLALHERGFDAHGFEPHPGLASAGERLLSARGHPGRMQVMARDGWPAGAPADADAVLVGWGSYMLVPGREHRVRFLAAARSVLPPGGPVLLSFFVRANEATSVTIARTANTVRRLRRRPPVEVGDGLVPNFVHGFTREELAGELDAAGFDLAHYADSPYPHAVGRARPRP